MKSANNKKINKKEIKTIQENNDKIIGERVEKLRKIQNLTQEGLAAKLHVSREVVAKWENGTRNMQIDQVISLSDYFNVSCDEILRGVKAEYINVHKVTGFPSSVIDVLQEMDESERILLRVLIIDSRKPNPALILGNKPNVSTEEIDEILSIHDKFTSGTLKALLNYLDDTRSIIYLLNQKDLSTPIMKEALEEDEINRFIKLHKSISKLKQLYLEEKNKKKDSLHDYEDESVNE